MNSFPVLSVLTFFPIIIGIVIAFVPKLDQKKSQALASFIAIGLLVICGALTSKFMSGDSGMQFVEKREWIPNIGATYSMGIDSIAVWMMLLTAFLTLVAVLISKPAEKSSYFYGLLLCLSGTLFGVFSSLDALLFYVFFELSLVPVALLILGWGSGDRGKVAMRYLGVLFAGSLLMLVSIGILSAQAHKVLGKEQFTLDLVQLQGLVGRGLWKDAWPLQAVAFWGFMIAFLIKSPIVPFHRWLSDTYKDAPIGAVVAGVVLKVGTFGMFRFCLPLFPEACKAFAPIIIAIGVVGIIYGGILAAIQDNPGRLMAYSTVSHVGYILIGLFSLNHYGMMGAAFQQVNHGIAAAAVFVLLSFLYERSPSRSLKEFGGLKKSMPVFSTLFLIAMLTNLGLPFTSGFVGEILALLGAFTAGHSGANGVSVAFAYVAAAGAILSAAYMLYMFQRLFYGKKNNTHEFKDLDTRETSIGLVFAAIILILGILPMTMMRSFEPRVEEIGNMVGNPNKMEITSPTVRYVANEGVR